MRCPAHCNVNITHLYSSYEGTGHTLTRGRYLHAITTGIREAIKEVMVKLTPTRLSTSGQHVLAFSYMGGALLEAM